MQSGRQCGRYRGAVDQVSRSCPQQDHRNSSVFCLSPSTSKKSNKLAMMPDMSAFFIPLTTRWEFRCSSKISRRESAQSEVSSSSAIESNSFFSLEALNRRSFVTVLLHSPFVVLSWNQFLGWLAPARTRRSMNYSDGMIAHQPNCDCDSWTGASSLDNRQMPSANGNGNQPIRRVCCAVSRSIDGSDAG